MRPGKVIGIMDGGQEHLYRRWRFKLEGREFVVYLFDGLQPADAMDALIVHYKIGQQMRRR